MVNSRSSSLWRSGSGLRSGLGGGARNSRSANCPRGVLVANACSRNRSGLLLATGARPAELLAVRWDDIDLDAEPPTLTITGTSAEIRGQGLIRSGGPVSGTI